MAFYLKNAQVLDVEKGTFFSADVKIENKKIVSLDEKAPDGADAVDCTGKYLIRGILMILVGILNCQRIIIRRQRARAQHGDRHCHSKEHSSQPLDCFPHSFYILSFT